MIMPFQSERGGYSALRIFSQERYRVKSGKLNQAPVRSSSSGCEEADGSPTDADLQTRPDKKKEKDADSNQMLSVRDFNHVIFAPVIQCECSIGRQA